MSQPTARYTWSPTALGRREMLRRLGLTGVAAVGLPTILAACGDDDSGGSTSLSAGDIAAATGQISVLGWEYYNVAENNPSGVSSEWGFLTANEDTITQTTTPGAYDLVGIFQGQLQQLLAVDRIQPVDESLLTNWGAIAGPLVDTDVIRSDGDLYAIPNAWGNSFVQYAPDQVDEPTSFDDLKAESLKGLVAVPDDPYAVITTFAALIGIDKPNNMNQEEFDATLAAMQEYRPWLRTVFPYGEEGQLFGRGDIAVSFPNFSGSLVSAQDAGANTGIALVGAWAFYDCWYLLAGSNNVAAAYAYMDQSLTLEAQRAMVTASLANPVRDDAIDALPENIQYESAEAVLSAAPVLPGVTVEEGTDEVPFQDWLIAWEEFKGA